MKQIVLFFVSVLVASGEQASIDTARGLIRRGEYAKAVKTLGTILESEPNNVDAHLVLGGVLALDGQRSEAIQELLKVVELKPDSAVSYNALGMTLSRFAEIKPAQEALENAVRLDPQFREAHVNLALVFAERGKLQEALDHLHLALQLDATTASVAYTHYLCAKIHSQQNDFDDAIKELEVSTHLQPAMVEGWISLGVARRAALDELGALQAFQRAAALDPSNPEAQSRLGAQYLATQNDGQAIVHLKEALRLDAENQATLYQLARALRQNGQAEKAQRVESRIKLTMQRTERANRTALEAAQLNSDGIELEKSGDVRSALEKYRQALDLNPDHDGFRLNYGLALCRLNRWDQGIAEMREILRHNPDNTEATRTLYIALDKQKAAKHKATSSK